MLLCWSAMVTVAVANALWPVRRPWWLKLPSFCAGWFVNEMPLHALAGHAVVVAVLVRWGALEGGPGRVGLVLSVASAVGLVVLAAAHRGARLAVDEALDRTIGDHLPLDERGVCGPSIPRSWLVLPWLSCVRPRGVERVADVVYYSTVGGQRLLLDIYRPTARQRDCPVLVEIHGGGWIAGHRRLEARPLMGHMAARGWVCISIDYRVGRSATWPDQLTDVKSALAWVRVHVREYGGDPDFVAITGGSAGGHLAALAALSTDDDEPTQSGEAATIRACVPFYGPYDFDNRLGLHPPGEMRIVERFVVKQSLADHPDLYERAAPLARVHADAPPFLVVQGTSDNLVFPAESRAFVDRLRSTSLAVVAHLEVPRGHHEFDAVASVRTTHVIVGVARFLAYIHSQHRHTAATVPRGGRSDGAHR